MLGAGSSSTTYQCMTSGPVGRSRPQSHGRPRFRPVAASHFRSRPVTAGPGLFCRRSGRLRFVRFICRPVTAHGQDGRIYHGCGRLRPVPLPCRPVSAHGQDGRIYHGYGRLRSVPLLDPSRLAARTVEFVTAARGCGQFVCPVGPSRLTAMTRG